MSSVLSVCRSGYAVVPSPFRNTSQRSCGADARVHPPLDPLNPQNYCFATEKIIFSRSFRLYTGAAGRAPARGVEGAERVSQRDSDFLSGCGSASLRALAAHAHPGRAFSVEFAEAAVRHGSSHAQAHDGRGTCPCDACGLASRGMLPRRRVRSHSLVRRALMPPSVASRQHRRYCVCCQRHHLPHREVVLSS